MDETVLPTVLPAYRHEMQLVMWCAHEQVWHWHGAVAPTVGAGNGHRVSHCACPRSPHKRTGYILAEIGPWTAEVRAKHRVRRRARCC